MGLDNPLHIAFLVVILLLVFGAKRLPEIGRSLGSGMREFKTSVTGETDNAQLPAGAQQPPPPAQAPVQPPAAQAPAAPAPAPPPPEPVATPAGQPEQAPPS
jgi:sec-independent protein translocase protein TatA